MKKIGLLVMVFFITSVMQAQIATPAPSPAATLTQVVGLTDVAMEFSRPAMRGRTIFGDLVPYGKIWRTGANMRTKISFSTDVVVDGQTIKAGTYAIFSKPSEKSWEVYFYSEYQGGGAPATWDESKVVASTTVPVYELPVDIQSFTISIDDVTDSSAAIGIMWEKTYVAIPFEVATDKAVMANIDKIMNGPDANDYYAAAVYYLSADKDIKKAKEWIDKAISMNEKPQFWQLRQQSLIYAKAGDKKGAIEAAKKSLAAAEVAGNADYVKMNKDSLKEWGAK